MKHTVYVAGKRFILVSDDKEDYVEKVAQEVNDAIGKITASNPMLDSRACAILCALDFADDMYKEVIKNQRFSEKAKEVMVQSDKHAKTVRELKEELQKAKSLNETQLHQIADKNVEIKQLNTQLDSLNKEISELKKQISQQKPKVEEKPVEKPVFSNNKQPFQNPVVKNKGNDFYKKKEDNTKPLKQISLFED